MQDLRFVLFMSARKSAILGRLDKSYIYKTKETFLRHYVSKRDGNPLEKMSAFRISDIDQVQYFGRRFFFFFFFLSCISDCVYTDRSDVIIDLMLNKTIF